jgi:hypothetical protein
MGVAREIGMRLDDEADIAIFSYPRLQGHTIGSSTILSALGSLPKLAHFALITGGA